MGNNVPHYVRPPLRRPGAAVSRERLSVAEPRAVALLRGLEVEEFLAAQLPLPILGMPLDAD